MDAAFGTTALDGLINVIIALIAAFSAGGATWLIMYLVIIYVRMRKREHASMTMVTMEVKISKDNEIKVDAAEQMFT